MRYAKSLPDGSLVFQSFSGEAGEGWVAVGPKENEPPRPSDTHRRAIVNGALVWVDDRSLASAKADKDAQINLWRLQANYSGFTYAGKEIATDQLSLLDLTNTATRIARTGSLPPNWPGGWKAKDNTYVAIATVGEWDDFYEAMYQQGLQNFVQAQSLKAQVAAAATLAEIDAVVWSS